MAKKTQATETPWQSKIVGYETVTTDSILANPRNWRIHPSPQQNALLGAIHGVGIIQNIVINKRTSELWPPGDRYVETLCDGHLRVTLALREGQPTLPATFVDLTPDEENLLLATFDPIAALAGVDTGQLGSLLHETTTSDAMLMEFLSNLAEEHGIVLPDRQKPVIEVEAEVDRAEELRKHYGVQVGQLWGCGEHRVICGDCTDKAVVERLMQGVLADAVVTDSPYGIGMEGIANDAESGLAILFDGMLEVLPCMCAVVINFQSTRLFPVWLDAIRRHGHHFERALWYVETGGSSYPWRGWMLKSQIILVSTMGGGLWPASPPVVRDNYSINFEVQNLGEMEQTHPTIKPIELIQSLVEHTDGLIYDPFLGSGTTLIAAQQLGRKCYGCEIDPGYTAVCLERFYKLTGVQPVLLEVGT